MKSFSLKIIAADKVFFSGRCEALIIPAEDGEMEILAHHEAMVIAVEDGAIRFRPEGESEWRHAITGIGFVQIAYNQVTLLVQTVELPEEIDIARAKKAKERAEEKLRQKQSIQEYYHSSASLARAMTRLREAGKHGM
ncbi:MAG: ATP synthase F1 subunit epsilon [Lachnospiraceae bacterium]|nr:ATP synthase F1 subunit epsilon [Lachnospiraceae bacterium]